MLGTPEASSGNEKILKSWGGGQIAIVQRFDAAQNKQIEMVDILGVRLPRRTAESGLPMSKAIDAHFKDLSFSEPEIHYLQAILMRQAIGHHGLFLGPPGLGKSRMAAFAAFLLNIPFYRIQCKKGMNVTQSFLWTYVPEDGSWKGRLGPLPVAMKEGALLLVDELPNLEPAERQPLLEPTEKPNKPIHGKAPTLTLENFPGGETTIEAVEGFFMLATGNYHEGQGVGEIHPASDREVRRVRPHMLGDLPNNVRPDRAVGRWFGPKAGTNITSTLSRVAYHEDGPSQITRETGELIANLFNAVESTLKVELASVKQEPPVYFTEALERAFDHFLTFQVKKAPTAGTAVEHRTREVIESAIAALDFYFINSFRENTKMRVPVDLQDTYKGQAKKPDGTSEMDDQGRTSVRAYIKWKIRRIIGGDVTIKTPVGETTAAFSSLLKGSLESGVALQEQKEKIGQLVSSQYPLASVLLKKLIEPEASPTLAKVKESLAHMSDAELKTFLEMKKPLLLIRPVLEPKKYRSTFDTVLPGKRADKPDANAVWDSQPTGALTFETVIVEATDVPDAIVGDNVNETLAQRRAKNEQHLLDMESYYLLIMRAKQASLPVDTSSETILSIETPEKIALGSFKNGMMDTSLKKTVFPQPAARFRKSIRKPIN